MCDDKLELIDNENLLLRSFFLLVPAAGFTQRATIDPETGEIHALSVSYVCF